MLSHGRWCGITLQWRHNGRDSVSNHQPHDCLLNHLFRRRSKITFKLCVTGHLCGEFTGDRWIPRTNGQFCGKCFHLMTSSWMQYQRHAYNMQTSRNGHCYTMTFWLWSATLTLNPPTNVSIPFPFRSKRQYIHFRNSIQKFLTSFELGIISKTALNTFTDSSQYVYQSINVSGIVEFGDYWYIGWTKVFINKNYEWNPDIFFQDWSLKGRTDGLVSRRHMIFIWSLQLIYCRCLTCRTFNFNVFVLKYLWTFSSLSPEKTKVIEILLRETNEGK